MKLRKLTKEETKAWCDLYWGLIDKGINHLEAHTIADNKIYGLAKAKEKGYIQGWEDCEEYLSVPK